MKLDVCRTKMSDITLILTQTRLEFWDGETILWGTQAWGLGAGSHPPPLCITHHMPVKALSVPIQAPQMPSLTRKDRITNIDNFIFLNNPTQSTPQIYLPLNPQISKTRTLLALQRFALSQKP